MVIQEAQPSTSQVSATTGEASGGSRVRNATERPTPVSPRARPAVPRPQTTVTSGNTRVPDRDQVEASVERSIGRFGAGETDLGAPMSEDETVDAQSARKRNLVNAYSQSQSRLALLATD